MAELEVKSIIYLQKVERKLDTMHREAKAATGKNKFYIDLKPLGGRFAVIGDFMNQFDDMHCWNLYDAQDRIIIEAYSLREFAIGLMKFCGEVPEHFERDSERIKLRNV